MLSDDLKIELEEICVKNGLHIDFDFNYPIKITVMKSMQIDFFKVIPEAAYLQFSFIIDQIDFDFIGDFKIDNELFSKLLNKVKKFHYIYLQECYKQRGNRFKNCVKKVFEITGGDYMAIVKKSYEG